MFLLLMAIQLELWAESATSQSAEDAPETLVASSAGVTDEDNWNNWSESEIDKKNSPQKPDGENLAPAPVVDTTGMEKAMEQELRETMIAQAKAYYPMIRAMSLESSESRVTLEIAYEAASEKDLVSIQANLNKEKMIGQIQILSPLLQKSEDMKMDGDLQLIESIQLRANPGLTSSLGLDAKLAFIQSMEVKLLRPVRLTTKQYPGLIRIEFRPYLAEDDQDEGLSVATDRDIVFQPPPPQNIAQVFGESFQKERAYENEVNFGGETTLLEQLEAQPQFVSTSSYTDYSRGASADAVAEDALARYPQFGSVDYWKKHLSGVFTNTTRLLKQRRNDHVILNEEPAMALIYDRKGPAHIRLGYNIQKQYPFFAQKQEGLAPADGLLRQDIQGGVVFTNSSPWIFSFQNKLGIATSENLSAPAKFGDRLTQYRYEAGHSVRYNLKRGFVQAGAGIRLETQERAIRDREIESYLSLLWFRPFSKKLAGRAEYNYEHEFFREGFPAIDMNVHRIRTGLEYKLSKNSLLKPSFGAAFYDGEAFMGLIGGLQYSHKLSPRGQMTLSYDTDFIRSEASTFASTSLSNSRVTSDLKGDLIRFQVVRAAYERKLSKKLSWLIEGSYRRESALEIEPKDKFAEYKLSTALRRNAPKKWVIELRYILTYLDAYQMSVSSAGGTTKLDEGNTRHEALLRVFRYFGDTK